MSEAENSEFEDLLSHQQPEVAVDDLWSDPVDTAEPAAESQEESVGNEAGPKSADPEPYSYESLPSNPDSVILIPSSAELAPDSEHGSATDDEIEQEQEPVPQAPKKTWQSLESNCSKDHSQ